MNVYELCNHNLFSAKTHGAPYNIKLANTTSSSLILHSFEELMNQRSLTLQLMTSRYRDNLSFSFNAQSEFELINFRWECLWFGKNKAFSKDSNYSFKGLWVTVLQILCLKMNILSMLMRIWIFSILLLYKIGWRYKYPIRGYILFYKVWKLWSKLDINPIPTIYQHLKLVWS